VKNVVNECPDVFNVLSISNYIVKRKHKFFARFINSQNRREQFEYNIAVILRPTSLFFVTFSLFFSCV